MQKQKRIRYLFCLIFFIRQRKQYIIYIYIYIYILINNIFDETNLIIYKEFNTTLIRI